MGVKTDILIGAGKKAYKKLTGVSKKSGNIKDKDGNIIGSRIYKEGSIKDMGIPKKTTKSDYLLKNKVKKVQKSPDKDFKYNNPETKTVKSDRTGKVSEVNKPGPVKGSIVKKKYIRDMKILHNKDVFGSNKIRDIQGAKDGGRIGKKFGGGVKKNSSRMNKLEELGRVDSEKAYSSKGKKNLKAEKTRIVKSLNSRGAAKRGHGAEIK